MQAIAFITSLLGLTTSNNTSVPTGAPVVKGGRDRSAVSCRGSPMPSRNVRLRRLPDGKVRVFGVPKEQNLPRMLETPLPNIGNGGAPMLYLPDDIPAYVDYVMGADWTDALQAEESPLRNETRDGGDEVILRPSQPAGGRVAEEGAAKEAAEGAAEEEVHCLRMRRCGAVVLRALADAYEHDYGDLLRHPYRPLFGWPSTGGVWVLTYPGCDAAGRYDISMPYPPSQHDRDRAHRYEEACGELKGKAHMDDVCLILQQAGARFYQCIEDCPEAQDLALIDA